MTMPLDNTQFETIMRDYNRRQNENRRILTERQKEIREKLPGIKEAEDELAAAGAGAARAVLSGRGEEKERLLLKVRALSEKKKRLLVENGYPEDYLELPCSCPNCRDTGFVDGKKCSCFLQAEIRLLYSQSNLQAALSEGRFEDFSLEYYPDAGIHKATGLTGRQMAERALETARSFVSGFDRDFRNLFFYGDTGVGKTFLSRCVAGELLSGGHSVLYFSAYDLFEQMADRTFGRREETVSDETLFGCDLLILDDLGTERTNSFVASSLFLLVNERMLRRKPVIISTNLNLKEFSERYSERTLSRIASSYTMVKLVGKDIRLQKRLIGGKQ